MNIFDYLRDLFVTKIGNLSLEHYSPYIINRWLSFSAPEVAASISCAGSKYFLENKEAHYKLLLTLLPKLKSVPRINYIKKVKEDFEEDKNLQKMSYALEISKRELIFLLEQLEQIK